MAENAGTEGAKDKLVRLVAGQDGVPTIAEIDEMLSAARDMDPSPNRDQTIDDLLDFRASLTDVYREQAAA